jgi:AbrB family looped-hinge helix DNA binding protein
MTMAVATISTKGQITLPVAVRNAVGLKPHDRVAIEASGDAIIVRKARDIFALKGFLGRALPYDKERTAMMKAAARQSRSRR